MLSSLGLKLEEEVLAEGGQDSDEASATGSDAPEPVSRSAADRDGGNEAGDGKEQDESRGAARGEELVIQELVVMPDSTLVGRTASSIELRTRYGINLLAVSRQGRRSVKRLRSTRLQAGDVLLMQGVPEAIAGFAGDYGCVPLATRDINVPVKGQMLLAISIFLGAVGITALGWLPVAVAFAAAVLAFMALRIVPPRSVYDAVDWPVIVLLGALLPVAGAMADTGTADVLATGLLDRLAQGNAVIALVLIMVVTMTLSDFMNNAATAAVMCPLAISISDQLGVNPDTYLMAVAIGASCAFLTPIGHQNNTLILGPGGFKFGDYWRLGLPVELLVIAVGTPVLLWVWPL